MNSYRQCPTCRRNLTPGMFKPYERDCFSCQHKATGGQRRERTMDWKKTQHVAVTTACTECGKSRAGTLGKDGAIVCTPCTRRRVESRAEFDEVFGEEGVL